MQTGPFVDPALAKKIMGPQTLYSTLIVALIVTRIDPFKGNPILIIKAPILLISAAECPIPATSQACVHFLLGVSRLRGSKREMKPGVSQVIYIYGGF